jgi:hypothetical protein
LAGGASGGRPRLPWWAAPPVAGRAPGGRPRPTSYAMPRLRGARAVWCRSARRARYPQRSFIPTIEPTPLLDRLEVWKL